MGDRGRKIYPQSAWLTQSQSRALDDASAQFGYNRSETVRHMIESYTLLVAAVRLAYEMFEVVGYKRDGAPQLQAYYQFKAALAKVKGES